MRKLQRDNSSNSLEAYMENRQNRTNWWRWF